VSEELNKIGYDGLLETLKKNDYEPIGIHNPQKFMLQLTAPNKKRDGKITLQLPNVLFDNTEDTRKFNSGKIKLLLLSVEDIKTSKPRIWQLNNLG